MSEEQTNDRKKSPGIGIVFLNDVAKAVSILEELASPRGARESYKAVVNRVSAFTNRIALGLHIVDRPIPPSRIDDIWRREAKFVRAHELDSLRAALEAKILGEVKNEHRTILDRLAACEAALRIQDEAFHRESIDGLRETARRMDSALDQRITKPRDGDGST